MVQGNTEKFDWRKNIIIISSFPILSTTISKNKANTLVSAHGTHL